MDSLNLSPLQFSTLLHYLSPDGSKEYKNRNRIISSLQKKLHILKENNEQNQEEIEELIDSIRIQKVYRDLILESIYLSNFKERSF